MHYKCKLCDYKTNNRNQMHCHHIIPRECNGSNKQHNLVYLCSNHHSMIYSPLSKKGIHSIKNDNSIEIIGYRNNGLLLEIKRNKQIEYI